MHPYREDPPAEEDRFAELVKLDAEQLNVRGIRRFLTTACALFSVAPWLQGHPAAWLPDGVVGFGVLLWATTGLMALVCWTEERRLGKRRRRALARLQSRP